MAKFAVIKSLISQDVLLCAGFCGGKFALFYGSCDAMAKKFSCDCKEIGRINKCGHIAQWRLKISLLRAKICRGDAVLAIKFVVLRENLHGFFEA